MSVRFFGVRILLFFINNLFSQRKQTCWIYKGERGVFLQIIVISLLLPIMIQADLLGDEVVPPMPVNGQPTGTVQSNQDLLAEIFGPSTSISSAASSPPTQPQRSKVDDILNLFGTSGGNLPSAPATPHPSAVPPSYTSSSLFAPTQAQSPPTPAVAAQPRLTSYTAYDKNDIKITLTPQTSAARPGVVMILARFQVSGSEPATGLSFQAAVPKVWSWTVLKDTKLKRS